MKKRTYVRIRSVLPGMIIDQSVLDGMGRVLVARGTVLDEKIIEVLRKFSIGGVYIIEGELEEQRDSVTDVSKEALKNIEKHYEEDRAKMIFSDDVKKRVSEAMGFLYNNTDSPRFLSAANEVAKELMIALNRNDAIAFDVNSLKISDEYTYKHSFDVAVIAMMIAKQKGMGKREIREIGTAGLLHDMGKSKISQDILRKPGKLTEEEFAEVKKHSVFGYHILKEKPDISNEILLGVLQHHEKKNGSGYPLGVKVGQISPYARILSIADIYDALITKRCYKDAISQREAVELLMSMTEELDIDAMNAFLKTVILYPVGGLVHLSSGELAKVVANNPNFPLRPKVVVLNTGDVYDLANDMKCANIVIQ